MAEELEVIIGANTEGLEKGATRADRALKDVEKSMNRLQKDIRENITISRGYASAIEDLTRSYQSGNISQKEYSKGISRLQRDEKETQIETKRLTSELNNLKRQQRQLAAVNTNATKGLTSFGRGAKVNATPAMQEFSRVIQDAPYGIQGVANNIQQLTSQFGYLQKSAGGTKAALKAMLSSLAGPTGILLAVSLVTTVLVQFGDKLFSSGEKAKTAAEKLEDYANSLEGVDKAVLDASKSSAKELIQLRLLEQQARNTALATDERKAAVDKLRKLYPEYLKGMSDEQVMANGLTTAYNNITDSILRKARAEAASNLMVKNLEEQLTLENQLEDTKNKLTEAQKKYNEANEKTKGYTDINSKEYRDAVRAQEEVEKLTSKVKDLKDQIEGKQLDNVKLENTIKAKGDLIVEPEKITVDETKGGKNEAVRIPVKGVVTGLDMQGASDGGQVQNLIDFNSELRNQIALLEEAKKSLPPLSSEYKNVSDQIEMLKNRLEGVTGPLQESSAKALQDFQDMVSGVKGSTSEMTTNISDQSEMLSSALNSTIGTTIAKLSEGEASFGSFVKTFIKGLGSIAAQMIQHAITEKVLSKVTLGTEQAKAGAKGITIATNSAAALGPFGAVALPGIIASTEAVIQGAFAGLQAFNFGGFVGDQNIVRMNGDERILTATQANRIDRMAMGQNAYSGQKIQVDITGHLVARGNDMVTVISRTEQKNSRRG